MDTYINAEGSVNGELNRRIQNSSKLYHIMEQSDPRTAIHEAYFKVMIHITKTWTFTKRNKSKTKKTMWNFREEFGIQNLLMEIEEKWVQSFSNSKRMDRRRELRRTSYPKFKGKGPVGWPGTRWFRQVLGGIKKRGECWQKIEKETFRKKEEIWYFLSIKPCKTDDARGGGGGERFYVKFVSYNREV